MSVKNWMNPCVGGRRSHATSQTMPAYPSRQLGADLTECVPGPRPILRTRVQEQPDVRMFTLRGRLRQGGTDGGECQPAPGGQRACERQVRHGGSLPTNSPALMQQRDVRPHPDLTSIEMSL